MDERIMKPLTIGVQFLILVFAICLVWFTLVYYPDVVRGHKFAFNFVPSIEKASASGHTFPIDTKNYRISYESGSNLYYAFIQGDTLAQYVENKNAAQLALKNSLEDETLCQENIIYASVSRLNIPEEYRNTSNCK